jgi:predicted GIY-YIG superfamily endonuclease
VPFYYVYILESQADTDRYYVGFTSDIKSRLLKHNSGQVPHTSKFIPWRIITAIAFECEEKARRFEKYLKTGSGRAFAKRHF